MKIRHGQIRWCTFPSPDKKRPVLILTRGTIIPQLTRISIAPITSTMRDIPSEVVLTPWDDGIPQECVVSLDNITTVSKQAVGSLIATLSPERMTEIAESICFAYSLDQYLKRE